MNRYVIIVAGGQGTRMKIDVPKQFLILDNKPILLHTLEAFYAFDAGLKLIVVLPESQMTYWKKMIGEYKIEIKHDLVNGGETRFDSVKNGLSKITDNGIVAIHDGVRPLVNHDTIKSNFDTAQRLGNAVTAVDLKDSIRMKVKDENKHVNRSEFILMQTPQTFDIQLIKEAYQQSYNEQFTDDASVFEFAGHKIQIVNGSYRNLKITTKEDLIIANALITNKN